MPPSFEKNIIKEGNNCKAMATPTKSNSSSKRKKWRPTTVSEAKKLTLSSEGDWKLAAGTSVTSRTRGKRCSRPSSPEDVSSPVDKDLFGAKES